MVCGSDEALGASVFLRVGESSTSGTGILRVGSSSAAESLPEERSDRTDAHTDGAVRHCWSVIGGRSGESQLPAGAPKTKTAGIAARRSNSIPWESDRFALPRSGRLDAR